MNKPNLWQKTKKYLLTPKQVMILDAHGSKQTRRLLIRPLTMLGAVIGLPLIGFIGGSIFSEGKGMSTVVPQYIQLQRDYARATDKLASTEAELAVAQQERDILKSDIATMQEQQEEFQQRVNSYESVLEARKAEGVQLIGSTLRWEDDSTIAFRITLVKGGNYPRRASGTIQILTKSPEGDKDILLPINEGGKKGTADALPYRMETHTFLYGKAKWTHDWRPQQFVVVCLDHNGKEIARLDARI